MKKLIICTAFAIGAVLTTQAQCDKKLILNASKAIFVGDDGSEERTKESEITIQIGKNDIKINPNDGANDDITGTFKELTCDWKQALKEGKVTSGKVEFSNVNGEAKNGKFSIEAKEGKLTFLLEIEENGGVRKIKVPIDKAKEE